jgi:uncharacterized YigZ family protein
LDTYLTIKQQAEGIYKEKGSKFLAYAIPVESSVEVKEQLQLLHKQYHDARHICYAYVLGADGGEYRVNDDGEPSGTAGKPIHGVLLSTKLTNVLIAVVRYFGGTKLGTSGLISAYKEAATDAINNALIIEKKIACYYAVSFPYELINDVMRAIKDTESDIIEQTFENESIIYFKVRKLNASTIENKMQHIENIKLKLLKTK